jgi:hypothetical protein
MIAIAPALTGASCSPVSVLSGMSSQALPVAYVHGIYGAFKAHLFGEVYHKRDQQAPWDSPDRLRAHNGY